MTPRNFAATAFAGCLLLSPLVSSEKITDYELNSNYKPSSIERLHRIEIFVNDDYSSTTITEIKRKLIHQDALLYLSNMRLNFAPSAGETLEVLEAYTILPTGEKIAVPDTDIKEHQQEIGNTGLKFNDRRTKLILFPGVGLNSELYVRYKTRETPSYQGHYFLRHQFDNNFVWENVELIFTHHANQNIEVKIDGLSGDEVSAPDGLKRYHFRYKNSTAIEKESGAVSFYDYAPYFSASTLKSHEDVGRLYWQYAKPKTENSLAVKELALALTKDITNKRKKAEILYYWVQKNIRYVSNIVNHGGLMPNHVDSVLAKRMGDCKDHTTILIALLNAVGISASPALINMGNAYAISGAATISPFNHVVTYVNEFDLYVDSTSRHSRFGQLYEEIAGKPTVIANVGKSHKTPLIKSSENVSYSEIEMTVREDGKIDGATTYRPAGATEINSRESDLYKNKSVKEKIVKEYLHANNESGFGTFETTDIEELGERFVVTAFYTLDEQSNFPGLGAMRLPIGFSPAHIKNQINQDVVDNRMYPWVCHSEDIVEKYRITLPKTVRITRLPQNTEFDGLTVKYQASYKLDGNIVTATKRLVKNYNSHVCGAQENQEWLDALKSIRRDQRSLVFYN